MPTAYQTIIAGQIRAGLIAGGATPAIADALLGSAYQESTFNIQGDANNRGGGNWSMWNVSTALWNQWKNTGVDVTNPYDQAQAYATSLRTKAPKQWKEMLAAGSDYGKILDVLDPKVNGGNADWGWGIRGARDTYAAQFGKIFGSAATAPAVPGLQLSGAPSPFETLVGSAASPLDVFNNPFTRGEQQGFGFDTSIGWPTPNIDAGGQFSLGPELRAGPGDLFGNGALQYPAGPSGAQLPPDSNPFGPSPGDWSPNASVYNTGGPSAEPGPGDTPVTFGPGPGALQGNDFGGQSAGDGFSGGLPGEQRSDPGFYDFSPWAGPGYISGSASEGGYAIPNFGGNLSIGPSGDIGGGADLGALYGNSGLQYQLPNPATNEDMQPTIDLRPYATPATPADTGPSNFGGDLSLGQDLNAAFGNYWTDPFSGETHVYDENWNWQYSIPADQSPSHGSEPGTAAGPSAGPAAPAVHPQPPHPTLPPLPPMYSNGMTPIYNIAPSPVGFDPTLGASNPWSSPGSLQNYINIFPESLMAQLVSTSPTAVWGSTNGFLNADGSYNFGPAGNPADAGSAGPNSQVALVRYL